MAPYLHHQESMTMGEPTTATAATFTAAASTVTLAVLGVDYYSLTYGLIGALFAVSHLARMHWARVVGFVMLSTVLGAMLGSAAIEFTGTTSRTMLILACAIGGAGSHGFMAALIKLVQTKINRVGEPK